MASSNIKLFDENKGNMLNDTEFNISTQRLNGLQTGVASSQLQNKAMYQASLVAYAIAQMMLANGQNANDTDAVSTFVNNLLTSIVQKVADKATKQDVADGTIGKWISSELLKSNNEDIASAYLKLAGGTMLGDLLLNADPTSALQAATKQYVDNNYIKMQILKRAGQSKYATSGGVTVTFNFEPKFVIVFSYPYNFICDSSQSASITTPVFLYAEGLGSFGSDYLHTKITKTGKNLTFKAEGRGVTASGVEPATWELNHSSATYYFIAFG